jgi:hypothetical protein
MADTTPKFLREQAERCRRLAASTLDERVARTLRGMSDEYDQKAKELAAREVTSLQPDIEPRR